jgi:hypothetical protein
MSLGYIGGGCEQVYTIRETRDRDEYSRSHPPAILAAQDQLLALNEKLEHIRSPHVCRYRTFEIKQSLAYMMRPYLYSTLHDRVLVCSSTLLRSFQLMCMHIFRAWCKQYCGH